MKNLFLSLLIIISLFLSGCNKNEEPPTPECNLDFLIKDTEGIPSNLTISSAYWVFGNQWNLHGNEVNYHLTEAHGHPDWISDIENTDVKWVLDIETYLFDYDNHDLFPDIDDRINNLADLLKGKEDNVSLFYLSDEPYLNGKEITRTMLETAISKIKAKFPGIPTYITFTQNYMLPVENDKPGTQPASKRGIPQGLDYISFDWYSNYTDGSSSRNIEEKIKPTVEEIKKLNSGIKILLTAEAYDETLNDDQLPEAIFRYWDYAASDPQIVGIDHFSWADNPNFKGLTSLPKAQNIVKALSKEVRMFNGRQPTDNKIPVYEWITNKINGVSSELRYDTWFWKNWTTSCYLIKEVKFYIRPAGEQNSSDLYLNYVLKENQDGTQWIDHQLSEDPMADGQTLARTSKLLGSVYKTQEPGTSPLYVFISNAAGNDHAYSTDITEYDGVGGYEIANNGESIGFVYAVN